MYFSSIQADIVLKLGSCTITIYFAAWRSSIIGILISRPINLAPLICIQHIKATLIGLQSQRHIKIHTGLPFLGTFGSNDNHTIGSLCTINRSGSGILQYLNGFYIIGRKDRRDVLTGHHTVNDIKRGIGIISERWLTTDQCRSISTARCAVSRNVHTGNTSLQARQHISRRNICYILHLDHSHRTGQTGLLLGHIAGHHYFINQLGIFRQLNA